MRKGRKERNWTVRKRKGRRIVKCKSREAVAIIHLQCIIYKVEL